MKIEGSDTGAPSHGDHDHREDSNRDVKGKAFSGVSVSENHKVIRNLSAVERINEYYEENLPGRPSRRHVSNSSDDSGYISNPDQSDYRSLHENNSRNSNKVGVSVRERIQAFEEKNIQKKQAELENYPIPEIQHEISIADLVDKFERRNSLPELDGKKSTSEDKCEFSDDDMDIDWEDETLLDKFAEFDEVPKELPGSSFDRKGVGRTVTRRKKNGETSLPSTNPNQTKSSQEPCPEEIRADGEIQRQLAQIFILRAGLSENATVLKDIEIPENGELNADFVLRAITDRESFVRLCNPYNLIRDAFMDLERIPESMRLILGEEMYGTLRGEGLRDAVWPAFSEGFWVFLDACDAQEKQAKLMSEFQSCDQYFPLELTRVIAKFHMGFGLAEKGLNKHSYKKTLSSDEKREVLLVLKMVDQLQHQFSALYFHYDQLPDSSVKSVLKPVFSDAQVDEHGGCKSKNLAGIQKGALKLLRLTDPSFDAENMKLWIDESVDNHNTVDPSVIRSFKQLRSGMQEKDPLIFYRHLVSQIVKDVRDKEGFSFCTMAMPDAQREKLRSFYEKVMADLYDQIDPLLGTISVDELKIIYKTTFDCIWREIESDLPLPIISRDNSRFFRLKSKKQKLKEGKQKMQEMAQTEFSRVASSMAVKIAYMQVRKQNQSKLGGG